MKIVIIIMESVFFPFSVSLLYNNYTSLCDLGVQCVKLYIGHFFFVQKMSSKRTFTSKFPRMLAVEKGVLRFCLSTSFLVALHH